MPQSLTQATVNKLIGGMVTEAGELTFPEGATVNELNCVLNRDGSRQRRRGLTPLENSSALGYTYSGDSRVFNYFVWKSAGGTFGLNILVLQIGNLLKFYDLSAQPLSSGLLLTKDMSSHLTGSNTMAGVCSFTTIFGGLIVASGTTNTVYLKYTFSTNTLDTTTLAFRIRDFEWQSSYDQLDRSVSTSTVSGRRMYDTLNAGWYGAKGGAALTTYTTTVGDPALGGLGGVTGALSGGSATPTTPGLYYPPLTHPWYSGKDSSGNFSKTEFDGLHNPSSVTGNGMFKLDFFSQDRTATSGITGLPVYVEEARFKTVATFAGRVFYAGLGAGKNSGKILFSQLVVSASPENALTSLGQCLQANDPTSELISDIIDTDGGVIEIPEAVDILKLHPYNDSIFVFASNGVWVVSGIDGRFSPTGYTVNKISTTGISTPQSFVSAEGIPFWWSVSSINTISFDENSGYPAVQDLSIGTVQTFFNNIGEPSRSLVVGDYDESNKKIFWWYPTPDGVEHHRNSALILDIPLRAFYPWYVSGTASKFVLGSFFSGSSSTKTLADVVTDNSGVDVTVDGSDVTVNTIVNGGIAGTELNLVYSDSGSFYFGVFSDKDYVDFGTQNYSSFFETGYFFAGDMLVKKNSPYVTVYLRSTEEGYTGNESVGYSPINPSGLLLKAYWDFKYESGSSQQCYRIKPYIIVNPADLTATNQQTSVITTRLKVRGKGRSMRLKFEAEEGKDFAFLGYSILVGINERF